MAFVNVEFQETFLSFNALIFAEMQRSTFEAGYRKTLAKQGEIR
jgi:hypothetical protein